MVVLAKFSEGMMTIYTDECIKNMSTWNHVNKDEVEWSKTAFVFTLTSFITSKQNMMKIVFLQQSSFVHACSCLQANNKKSFKHFASPKGLNFSSKFRWIKWVGKVPSLRWSWMNTFFFVHCTVWSSLEMKILRKRIKNTTSCSVWFHDSGWVYKECKCSYLYGLHEQKNYKHWLSIKYDLSVVWRWLFNCQRTLWCQFVVSGNKIKEAGSLCPTKSMTPVSNRLWFQNLKFISWQ